MAAVTTLLGWAEQDECNGPCPDDKAGRGPMGERLSGLSPLSLMRRHPSISVRCESVGLV